MPELGEVAHATSLLRRFLLNRTITAVTALPDDIVFVKPLVNSEFEQLAGSKVTGVGRQGKYFWFECQSKTVLMHFGMTGWIHVRDIRTHFIMMEGGGDKKQAERIKEMKKKGIDPAKLLIEEYKTEVWPPKFTKFILTTDDNREIAFSDPRRLGRVRVFDAEIDQVRQLEPLSKLGADFSQDPLSEEEVTSLILKRKVPVKSLLMDQSVFSGIGNWMADEILFQARIHPEQYSNTLSSEQCRTLYAKLIEVCKISAENEGNTGAFPEDWLMLYRWGKARKKEVQKLPSGHAIKHVTVGGRTSSYVPDLQKLPGKSTVQDTKLDIKDETPDEIKTEDSTEPTPSTKKRRKN